MPLESLIELVETLRKRIGGHRAALSGNEMLTRYALVDPLLCELGWDTADPAIVIPEDTSGLGRGRPDYVLQNNGQPAMVIEAKRLGSGLQNGARQAIDYAMDANRQARYFAITDGQHWEIYDTNRPASDMSAISFDLMAASSAEVCLNVLSLWQPNVEAANVSAAQRPIVGLEAVTARPDVATRAREDSVALPAQMTTEAPTHMPQPVTQPQAIREHHIQPPYAPTRDANEWITLTELTPQPYSKPAEIVFPDGSKIAIQTWRSVPIEATRWLIKNGFLRPAHCPIKYSERAKRYILAVSPYHPNGNAFTAPEQVETLYVDTHYSGRNLVGIARTIIQQTGQDTAQFKVRLSS